MLSPASPRPDLRRILQHPNVLNLSLVQPRHVIHFQMVHIFGPFLAVAQQMLKMRRTKAMNRQLLQTES
jgi:hypothetical protein